LTPYFSNSFANFSDCAPAHAPCSARSHLARPLPCVDKTISERSLTNPRGLLAQLVELTTNCSDCAPAHATWRMSARVALSSRSSPLVLTFCACLHARFGRWERRRATKLHQQGSLGLNPLVVGFYDIHPKAHKVGQPLCDSLRTLSSHGDNTVPWREPVAVALSLALPNLLSPLLVTRRHIPKHVGTYVLY